MKILGVITEKKRLRSNVALYEIAHLIIYDDIAMNLHYLVNVTLVILLLKA